MLARQHRLTSFALAKLTNRTSPGRRHSAGHRPSAGRAADRAEGRSMTRPDRCPSKRNQGARKQRARNRWFLAQCLSFPRSCTIAGGPVFCCVDGDPAGTGSQFCGRATPQVVLPQEGWERDPPFHLFSSYIVPSGCLLSGRLHETARAVPPSTPPGGVRRDHFNGAAAPPQVVFRPTETISTLDSATPDDRMPATAKAS